MDGALSHNSQVIERVHYMARKQKQPRLVDKTPKFEWRPDFPVHDEINLNISHYSNIYRLSDIDQQSQDQQYQ